MRIRLKFQRFFYIFIFTAHAILSDKNNILLEKRLIFQEGAFYDEAKIYVKMSGLTDEMSESNIGQIGEHELTQLPDSSTFVDSIFLKNNVHVIPSTGDSRLNKSCAGIYVIKIIKKI